MKRLAATSHTEACVENTGRRMVGLELPGKGGRGRTKKRLKDVVKKMTEEEEGGREDDRRRWKTEKMKMTKKKMAEKNKVET